jgi:hypothetical protein
MASTAGMNPGARRANTGTYNPRPTVPRSTPDYHYRDDGRNVRTVPSGGPHNIGDYKGEYGAGRGYRPAEPLDRYIDDYRKYEDQRWKGYREFREDPPEPRLDPRFDPRRQPMRRVKMAYHVPEQTYGARLPDGRMPGRHNGRAINGMPEPARYDNRYGRPGTNNPPYPSMDERSPARQMDSHRGQMGRQRAFEARMDSGRYTPEQAAAGVDRQYGYARRPNDPGYYEGLMASRGSYGGGPVGGNMTGGYGSGMGRPDNYGRSSVSGGGSFGTSPSPNR